MAGNFWISDQAASSAMNGIAAQLSNGFMDIYAGTQPANANTNTSGAEYILYEFTFAAGGGTVTGSSLACAFANAGATTTISTGIATFFGLYMSSRARLAYGNVSTVAGSADQVYNTNNVVPGVSAAVTSYVIALPEH